ncbi:MAG: glutamine-hydrolyzing carbamoyl-phosphate synthase small subunit [Candidatus Caenarcaniphilales bacterium]|nr:glutamine-hydrolyzing carbamoyl-phosphate synthase small subunit [Candidatus Caenarcaniphilales bacterium]
MSEAFLLLEDGGCFVGQALGVLGQLIFGEVVFNTGMTGYQEILTDPSYAGQIVTLTYPEIGNYGIYDPDNQSRQAFAKGLVIRQLSPLVSTYQSQAYDLNSFLLKQKLSGISGIDTRALTRKLRVDGAMRGLLGTSPLSQFSREALLTEIKAQRTMHGQDLTEEVTTKQPYWVEPLEEAKGVIAVLDYGLKRSMLELLRLEGYRLYVLPANAGIQEVLSQNPDGIFLSNGPGDPAACLSAREVVRGLVANYAKPIFGVCLGHQILAEALGAKTFKLKFGHRGSNHPVKDLSKNCVFITSQNHGFAVDEATLPKDQVEVTHISLNDGTVEGLRHKTKTISSVQFHPEAAPGPQDTRFLFQEFTQKIKAPC